MRLVGKVSGDFFLGTGILFGGGGRGVLSLYKPKIWEMGAGQRRKGAMLSIQSKNRPKLIFSWFLPDVLTGWTILLKFTPINQ
jgi:hypothetical protein